MDQQIHWIDPQRCDPPHRVSHPEKCDDLIESFSRHGWGKNYPALIGYPWGGRIQLLSGSHRIVAARRVGLDAVPVVLRFKSELLDAWGDLEQWKQVMSAPLVS